MPSWNAPLLTNYIRNDVPAIQVLLHASARWNPEDPTTEICTDVQNGFKRLVESTQTDSTITKQVRFETYNGETWKSVGKLMHDVDTDQKSAEMKLNFSVIATPAEGTAGRFVRIDRNRFGEIEGITDRDYYTNSCHVPVWHKCTVVEKIRLEAPFHALCNGGHITYIELDGDPLVNLPAFVQIIKFMKEAGIGYGSINHPVDRCPICGYTGIITDECPRCHVKEGQELTHAEIETLRKCCH